jgi:hypothetical protein
VTAQNVLMEVLAPSVVADFMWIKLADVRLALPIAMYAQMQAPARHAMPVSSSPIQTPVPPVVPPFPTVLYALTTLPAPVVPAVSTSTVPLVTLALLFPTV